MTWRSHAATGRAHAFERSERTSDCGLACKVDCAQELLPGINERTFRLKTADGETLGRAPLSACCLCLRILRGRMRRELAAAKERAA